MACSSALHLMTAKACSVGTDKGRSRSRSSPDKSRSRSVGGNRKLTTHAASKVGVGIARIKEE